jgi:hypothetical protein
MIYESSMASELKPGQFSAIYGKATRDYLNQVCATGPDGKTKEWRIFDKDVEISGEQKHWVDAMKRDRKTLPWVIISNGKTGYEGPIPETADAFMSLLKKYSEGK